MAARSLPIRLLVFCCAIVVGVIAFAPGETATQRTMTQVEEFRAPTVNGLPLDYCRIWAAECGKPAADEYCRRRGFRESVHFEVGYDQPNTWSIGANRLCNYPQCDRITLVRCVAEVTTTGGDRGSPPAPEARPRLNASLACHRSPFVLGLGEEPSQLCTITIRGFRRNTSDPVQVVLPSAVDAFGNHRNGIQVNLATGSELTYDWGESKEWTFLVYACAQPRMGANCYGNAAVPGPFSLPISVRQNGAEPANLTLGGEVWQRAPTIADIVRLQNRWRPDQFINVERGLSVSPIDMRWLSPVWHVEPIPGQPGLVRLRNAWRTDQYLHIERGPVEAGPIRPEWSSALWRIEPADAGGWMRIRSQWKPDLYLHIERGALEAGPIRPEWWSAQWKLAPAR
jgi:hypothetical protein